MDDSEKISGANLGKDWAMALTMKDLVRTTPQKNLTPVEIIPATRNTKLVLIIAPEWGIYFPPYNLARLASVTRAAGYNTTVYDINVKSWHKIKEIMHFDPWHHAREWMWVGKNYYTHLHKHLKPLFDEYIEKIVASKPDVIGLSMYYTNEEPTNYLAISLRRKLPKAKIIVGGPNAAVMNPRSKLYYDHIVEGEGEHVILNILDKVEKGEVIESQTLKKDIKIRLDLDSLPFPDYTDYDLNEYSLPGGISSEISRGCVAKCVFCTEVHFWKYRGRMSGSLLNEIKHQKEHYGANFIWFIDSLVNGNLKELRGFALGIKEQGLDIKWQGYARCDGRMDLAYFQDLADSGCLQLSYGIESGSQKVLDLMKKEITVEEVEANMRDGAEVGIQAHTNWIVGFPNEDTLGFADTMILMWRIKNYNIMTISPGLSLILSPGAEMTDNMDQYNIAPNNFLNMWTTKDFCNTKVHRLIRMKTLGIFLENLNSDIPIHGFDRPNLKNTYEIKYNPNRARKDVAREEFDYNIITGGPTAFANSVMNEIWAFLRTFWRAFGAYEVTIKFRPKEDLDEFGDRLGCDYTADHHFKIDSAGNWVAEHSYKFVHINHDGSPEEFWSDHSFEYAWQGSGQWSV